MIQFVMLSLFVTKTRVIKDLVLCFKVKIDLNNRNGIE